jgi:ubiquinone/menaquinone biosynthesis C-methylase UbiE
VKRLAEMRRILKPGGALLISNLDPGALNGVDRIRCLIRIVYHGLYWLPDKTAEAIWEGMS